MLIDTIFLKIVTADLTTCGTGGTIITAVRAEVLADNLQVIRLLNHPANKHNIIST
jgi:hypothetical protein